MRCWCVDLAGGVDRASVALGTRGIKRNTGLMVFPESSTPADGRNVDGGCTAADRGGGSSSARRCRTRGRRAGAAAPSEDPVVLCFPRSRRPCSRHPDPPSPAEAVRTRKLARFREVDGWVRKLGGFPAVTH